SHGENGHVGTVTVKGIRDEGVINRRETGVPTLSYRLGCKPRARTPPGDPPMPALIHLALVLQASVGIQVGTSASDSAKKARAAERRARSEMWSEEVPSRRERKPGRRIPLTDELRASAFRDAAAKSLLLRA